eukprot:2352165-Pyramimonas_sp.AAC.1
MVRQSQGKEPLIYTYHIKQGRVRTPRQGEKERYPAMGSLMALFKRIHTDSMGGDKSTQAVLCRELPAPPALRDRSSSDEALVAQTRLVLGFWGEDSCTGPVPEQLDKRLKGALARDGDVDALVNNGQGAQRARRLLLPGGGA